MLAAPAASGDDASMSVPAPNPPAAPAERRPPFDKRVLLLALGIFAIYADAYMIAGTMLFVSADLGRSPAAVGQTLTAYMLIAAIGAPVLAVLSARWRSDWVVVAALAGFAITDVLCALAPSFEVLLLARCAAAAFSALFSPLAFGLAAALAPPGRSGLALAVMSAALVSAQLVGVPIGAEIGSRLGWRASFAVDAVLIGVTALLLRFTPLPSIAGGAHSFRERIAPLADPRVLVALLPSMFIWMGSNTVYLFTTPMFGGFGFGVTQALLACFGLGGIAGSFLGGRVADAFGPRRALPVGLGIAVANLALMTAFPATPVVQFVGYVVMACCGWALFPLQQSRLLAMAPAHRTLVLSLNNSAANLGTAVGGALGALVMVRASGQGLLLAAAVATGVALLIVLASGWSSAARTASESPR
jgi:predicted MFS family arabinose efflux permease